MRTGRSAGLRARLLLVVGLGLLPVAGLGAYLVQHQWRSATQAAQENALRVARLAVARFEGLARGAEQWLAALGRLPEIRAPGDGCAGHYAQLLADHPSFIDLGVATPDGSVRCSARARERLPEAIHFGEVLAARPFAVGAWRSESDQAEITFAHRLHDARGSPTGIVYATVDLAWLDLFAAEALLPERASLSIVDSDGRILASLPASARPGVAEARGPVPLFAAVLRNRDEGTAEGEDSNGVAHLYAYSPLPVVTRPGSAYVFVAIPADVAYARVSRVLGQIVAGVLIVSFMVLFAVWKGLDLLVLRHVRTLLETARRLAAGDLSARTRIPHDRGEIAQLAHRIDDMAATLQARDVESRRAQEALIRSEERFRRLAENARDIVFRARVHPEWAFEYVSAAAAEVTGYTPEEHYRDPDLLRRMVHPDDRVILERAILRRAFDEPLQLRWIRKDGTVIWTEHSVSPLHDESGRLLAVEGIARDITERRRTEEELRLLQRISAAVGEAEDVDSALAVVLRDACRATGWAMGQAWLPYGEGGALKCSPAWYAGVDGLEAFRAASEVWTVPADSPGMLARAWRSRAPVWVSDVSLDAGFGRRAEAMRAGLRAAMAVPVLAGTDLQAVIEFYLREARPEDHHFARTVSGVAAQLGALIRRKRSEERLLYLAHHDVLTGLPNRALFNDRLRQAMVEAHRHERLVGVAFIDIDRFKTINDSLGHETGDRLLEAVAGRIQGCVREGDTVSRISGDEFALVLADMAHVDDAARVARNILDSFSRPFHVEGHDLYVSASVGITIYPFDDRDVEGLLRNADVAMYRAKELGRNTYQFYAAEMTARARERLALEGALRRALEREEFTLRYQPIVDLRGGRVVGVEALLRWRHPERGMVMPEQFVSIAEETGLIVPLGEWVLRTACAQCREWEAAGLPPLRLGVNISARQFQRPDLADTVARILEETGMPPKRLELELTETLLMQSLEATIAAMQRLSAMGVQLSIDDFGTGYSSLAYLKRLPIDRLKIDRSFVQDIPGDPDDAAIASAIIAIAHKLDLTVVAEGVESGAQLAFLRSHGCDVMQGYYFSEPIEPAEFAHLLATGLPALRPRPARAGPRKVRES
ncbi:hypothetical protein SVA_0596 [Sulfurifustis variabilis]|uniref:cyclic-guanylate-specific phosphodiesterase n=1 Tax=Sulfurifustis variabilis TaxID=1675686 RepID=A0A1B4V1P6_9GAMM|nr:EAL domain-containing protein [Sulfurifustis variabilis]BAU47175.1 hypothetical protein SVA_0596 [Sulfurifustis variabilis]